jgi:hypothetical protein
MTELAAKATNANEVYINVIFQESTHLSVSSNSVLIFRPVHPMFVSTFISHAV